MTSTIRKALIAGGLTATALVGGGLGGAMLDGVASAQTSDSTTTTVPANSADARPAREPRAELTGTNASKAIAAAKAAVTDATAHGVHSGRDGGYVVGMQKSDGTHVKVLIDSDFKVIEVKEGGPRGRGHGPRGPRGPRPGDTTPTTAASS